MAGQAPVDWRIVVEQIARGDQAGEETLYSNLVNGARLFLQRRLGTQNVDDRVHDLFLIVVQAIRRGELREPERLMGFVRTVLYRQLNLEISGLVSARDTTADANSLARLTGAEPTPEQQTLMREQVDLMKRELGRMSDRDAEILTRFYLREQPAEVICREMGLTADQVYLRKSRAKARLAGLVRGRVAGRPLD